MLTSEELERVEQLKRVERYLANAIDILVNDGYSIDTIRNMLCICNDQDYEDYLSIFEDEEE